MGIGDAKKFSELVAKAQKIPRVTMGNSSTLPPVLAADDGLLQPTERRPMLRMVDTKKPREGHSDQASSSAASNSERFDSGIDFRRSGPPFPL